MKKINLVVMIGLVVGGMSMAKADVPINLSWTTPTENTDNTPIGVICCYNMYKGTKADGSDLKWFKQVSGTVHTDTETIISNTTSCFTVAAVTTITGVASNVVCKTAPAVVVPPVVVSSAKAPTLTGK